MDDFVSLSHIKEDRLLEINKISPQHTQHQNYVNVFRSRSLDMRPRKSSSLSRRAAFVRKCSFASLSHHELPSVEFNNLTYSFSKFCVTTSFSLHWKLTFCRPSSLKWSVSKPNLTRLFSKRETLLNISS